jgi:hypothetical protein
MSAARRASMATDTTGSATTGGSRTSGSPGSQRVAPALAVFGPVTATMSPATAVSTSQTRSAWTRTSRMIRSARRAPASHTATPFRSVPEYTRR